MQRIFALILLIFISAGLCFSQDANWYLNKPIKDIIFTGLENIDAAELKGLTDPFVGQDFTNELFMDLQSKILALRYFDQFKANAIPGDPDRKSVIIEFIVKEVPLISKLTINGNRSVRTSDILDVILLSKGDLMSKTLARIDAKEIEKLYMEKGYPDVAVEWEVKEGVKSKTELIFNITEGSQTRVKSILFEGNEIISSGTLKRKLETKSNSLIHSGVFQEENLNVDKSNIENFYHERGYIDAKVIDIQKKTISEEGSDKTELELTYYIEEGNQWTFGTASVEGNTLFTEEEILKLIRFKKGTVINLLKLQQDIEAIKDLYFNDGYVANNFAVDEKRNEEDLSIDFNITVYERSRSHVENIIIKGNEKTKDYVLYREVPLEIGDIFYKDKITQGLMNLYSLNFFDNLEVDTPIGSADGLLDLIITVEEARTSNVEFGVTFTGEQGTFPITGFFKYTDINFKGKGQEMSIGTNISSTTQNLEFSFKENWLFGKRIYAKGSVALQHSVEQNVLQDRLYPVGNGVPDPFEGTYVYADTGDPWEYDTEGPPTDAEIRDNDLVTDYEYAISKGYSIDSDYLMQYDQFDLILDSDFGYIHHTDFHNIRLGFGTGLRTAFSYIDYDQNVYRPYEETVRENHQTLNFVPTLKLSLTVDSRDNPYYPSSGFVLKQYWGYTGGILFGSRNFNKSITAGEAYLELFNVPVTKEWNYRNVLAVHSSLQSILPQYGQRDDGSWGLLYDSRTTSDLLYMDGWTMARGWPLLKDLECVWDNWLEIRMPIAEKYLWADTFISATAGWSDYRGIRDMKLKDFRFSFGVGIRSVIQMLPIGFYIVKRFKFDENNKFQWQAGPIDPDGLGLNFVISFNQSL